MLGDLNLLKEMKKITRGKKSPEEATEELDGISGHQEIVNRFKQVYAELYNKADSNKEMEELEEKIENLIKEEDSFKEVLRLTGHIVKLAVTQMKPRKSDVSGGFHSECLLHPPDSLFEHLSVIFRS